MVNIFSNLSANIDFNQDWQQLKQISPVFDNEIALQQYINAKNLACPMPLLKLKVALKKMQINHSIYITTTDPNSQHDIGAFCQYMGYDLLIFVDSNNINNSDTIFHLLVTKNS